MSSLDWKPSLFLVDDEPDQVFLTELAAHRSGEFRQVKTAIDSQMAYQQLTEFADRAEQRPDVVLIDWKMPRMHGSELAAALQAHQSLRAIPVITLSSSSFEGDRKQALEAGCKAFYQKPNSFEKLIQLLREIRHEHCEVSAQSKAG